MMIEVEPHESWLLLRSGGRWRVLDHRAEVMIGDGPGYGSMEFMDLKDVMGKPAWLIQVFDGFFNSAVSWSTSDLYVAVEDGPFLRSNYHLSDASIVDANGPQGGVSAAYKHRLTPRVTGDGTLEFRFYECICGSDGGLFGHPAPYAESHEAAWNATGIWALRSGELVRVAPQDAPDVCSGEEIPCDPPRELEPLPRPLEYYRRGSTEGP